MRFWNNHSSGMLKVKIVEKNRYIVDIYNLVCMTRFWNNHSSATVKVKRLESQIIIVHKKF